MRLFGTTHPSGGRRLLAGTAAALAAAGFAVGAASPALAAASITVTVNSDTQAKDHIEGVLYSYTIATFTDSGACSDACNSGDSYTARIEWGDYSPATDGVVTLVSSDGSTGTYQVTASHIYVDEFSCPATADAAPAGSQGSGGGACGWPVHVQVTSSDSRTSGGMGLIAVKDQPIGAPSGSGTATLSAVVGTPLSGVLGSFWDSNPTAIASQPGSPSTPEYKLSIVWGDGSAVDTTSGTAAVGACVSGVEGVDTGCPVTVSGSHTYTAAGTYACQVTVVDGRNTPPYSFTSTCVVTKAASSVATTPSPTSTTVGNSFGDTAKVTGYSPTGTVTFSLYGPGDTACATNLLAGDSAATVALSGGQAGAPSFKAAKPGVYQWVASYSGDGNNLAASGKCGDTSEQVVVSQTVVLAITGAWQPPVIAGGFGLMLLGAMLALAARTRREEA